MIIIVYQSFGLNQPVFEFSVEKLVSFFISFLKKNSTNLNEKVSSVGDNGRGKKNLID